MLISPGFPDEMPFFTHALAEVEACVFGVGDQPMLPITCRSAICGTRRWSAEIADSIGTDLRIHAS